MSSPLTGEEELRTSKLFALLVLVFILCPLSSFAQAPASDDSSTSKGRDRNSGDSPFLSVDGPNSSTYIRFDLSRLPQGATGEHVSKATVRLFVSDVAEGGSFDVKRVASPWNEQTLDG